MPSRLMRAVLVWEREHPTDGSVEWKLAACRVARAAQTKRQELSSAIEYGAFRSGWPHSDAYDEAVKAVMRETPLPPLPPKPPLPPPRSSRQTQVELRACSDEELHDRKTQLRDAIAQLRTGLAFSRFEDASADDLSRRDLNSKQRPATSVALWNSSRVELMHIENERGERVR